MTTELNNRTHPFNPDGENSNGTFQEHDSQMQRFRTSHADVALVNRPRPDEATFLESLLFLKVNYVMETGGSALPDGVFDQSPPVTMRKVARYKLSQN